jgi:quinol monooxygenase YgiN
VENANQFLLIEGFRDADAGSSHVGSQHFKDALLQTPPMLVDTPRLLYAEIPGTEWSVMAEMTVSESGST